MNELIWILSSSVLILAVLLIRALFGRKLRPGLRYALWALVLVRLLLPGSLWTSPVNVEAPVSHSQLGQDLDLLREVDAVTYSPAGQVSGTPARPASKDETAEQPMILAQDVTPERFERLRSTLSLRNVAETVWVTGSVAALAIFVTTNVLFYVNLRRRRRRLDLNEPVRVYEVEGLESSCLFLNSIYVNSETAADETKLRHVLAHELSHRRHLDGLWALMRCAALTVHWFNPLVWLAASKSRQDSELFADAGALRRLGEAQRESYGGTLISLSVHNARAVSPLCAATAMAGGKRSLRERVELIARKPRATVAVLLAVAFIAGIAVGCTFAGAAYEEPPAGGEASIDPAGTGPEDTSPAGTEPAGTKPAEPPQTPDLAVFESDILGIDLVYPADWAETVTLSDGQIRDGFFPGISDPVTCVRIDLREDVFGVPPYNAFDQNIVYDNAVAFIYWSPAGVSGPEVEYGESVTLYAAGDGGELRCFLPMNTKLNWTGDDAGPNGERIFNAYDTIERDILDGKLTARLLDGWEPTFTENGPLSQAELEAWAELLRTDIYDNGGNLLGISPVNGFFRSNWSDPRYLDFQLFVDYIITGEELDADSDPAEREAVYRAYREQYGEELLGETPIRVLRLQEVNSVLQTYAGITVDDLASDWRAKVFYVPEYDTIYTFTSDFDPGYFIPLSGERVGDTVTLYSSDHILTIRTSGNSWQLMSHLPR